MPLLSFVFPSSGGLDDPFIDLISLVRPETLSVACEHSFSLAADFLLAFLLRYFDTSFVQVFGCRTVFSFIAIGSFFLQYFPSRHIG